MGHVTVSLEKKDEDRLRNLAKTEFNNKKGAMAKVISKSLELLSRKSKRQRAMERQFRWMDQGFNLGKILVKHREEIYDRKQGTKTG